MFHADWSHPHVTGWSSQKWITDTEMDAQTRCILSVFGGFNFIRMLLVDLHFFADSMCPGFAMFLPFFWHMFAGSASFLLNSYGSGWLNPSRSSFCWFIVTQSVLICFHQLKSQIASWQALQPGCLNPHSWLNPPCWRSVGNGGNGRMVDSIIISYNYTIYSRSCHIIPPFPPQHQ